MSLSRNEVRDRRTVFAFAFAFVVAFALSGFYQIKQNDSSESQSRKRESGFLLDWNTSFVCLICFVLLFVKLPSRQEVTAK